MPYGSKKLMKRLLRRVWQDQRGGLTWEWILLVTLLVVGIVGGLSGVRDTIIDELGDIADAALSIDQSWTMRFCTDCSNGNFTTISWTDAQGGPVTRNRK